MPVENAPRMQALIVRPFGRKDGIDFDKVESSLIRPALSYASLEAISLWSDMGDSPDVRPQIMQRLAASDIVVVDISNRNPNVLYELGIRHALRPRRTLAITADRMSVPADLLAMLVFQYDPGQLFASVHPLAELLKNMASSDATDSPVYLLLSNLTPPPISNLQVVPLEFREAVERVSKERNIGDLAFLAAEVATLGWSTEAFRLVGKAQLALRDLEGARETWEAVRAAHPSDVDAVSALATIYQRLKEVDLSNQAIQRILTSPDLSSGQRAEALASQGRNTKDQWTNSWRAQPEAQRRRAALESPFLEKAFDAYYRAFRADLNHYYSGLNALSLLTVRMELAAALQDVWTLQFDSEIQAKAEMQSMADVSRQLAGAVYLSIDAARDRASRAGKPDRWLEIAKADLSFVTGDRPTRVVAGFLRALRGANDFEIDSTRRQLEFYRELNVFADRTGPVLDAIGSTGLPPILPARTNDIARVLLFTGHMIDSPGRSQQRFPPAMETVARDALRDAVRNEVNLTKGCLLGMSGASNGGDILFHEVCHELHIDTQVYLVLPDEQYLAQSVAPGGTGWVDRFWKIRNESSNVRVLQQREELPVWLKTRKDYNVWQRSNVWLLYNALALRVDTTLIALWNGERGDAPGGTQDMIATAQARGVRVVILDTRRLFGLS